MTLPQFQRWLRKQLASLSQSGEGINDLQEAQVAAITLHEARQHAFALGLPDLIPAFDSHEGGIPVMPVRDAQKILSLALAGLPTTTIESPYLDSQQAADYLQVTMKSLYELVARRRLTPLRGPRRTYRFTRQQLDQYLAQNP